MKRKQYHYVECGLPNVYLKNGFKEEKTPYGNGVVIHDIAGLHRCIGKILVDKPTTLTGAEFRFLRRELDMSQRVLADLFSCSERTIREWEHGARYIEMMYGPEKVDELLAVSRETVRYRLADYEAIEFEYREKFNSLGMSKGESWGSE